MFNRKGEYLRVTEKEQGLKTDDIGGFWVVTYPTELSILEDILFYAKNVLYMANQFKGGLKESEVYGFYFDEGKAKKAAKNLLEKN